MRRLLFSFSVPCSESPRKARRIAVASCRQLHSEGQDGSTRRSHPKATSQMCLRFGLKVQGGIFQRHEVLLAFLGKLQPKQLTAGCAYTIRLCDYSCRYIHTCRWAIYRAPCHAHLCAFSGTACMYACTQACVRRYACAYIVGMHVHT